MAEGATALSASVLAAIAVGGAAGSVCRHLLVLATARLATSWGAPQSLPLGVPAANIIGGLAVGVLAVSLTRLGLTDRFWPLLITGFLGGFTTFSAFSWEILQLWERERADLALIYLALNLLGALGGVALGAMLARASLGAA
ncbi:MAG: fluoride efflux transporter CrcB [Pseudomonadota bacterium]